MKRALWVAVVLGALLTAGCGGAQRQDAALSTLADLQRQAEASKRAVVVIASSDEVAAWHELDAKVLSTPEGQQQLEQAVVWRVDLDQPSGAAAAAHLRIMVVPTAVVLRQVEGRWVEFGRLQGFVWAAAWRDQLQTLLQQAAPNPIACEDRSTRTLVPSASPEQLPADLGCVATGLFTAEHARGADKLRALLHHPAWPETGRAWPEDTRRTLANNLVLLGPYGARVARDPRACASDMARLGAWRGLPASHVPAVTLWHARCEALAGRSAEALAVLDRFLATRSDEHRAMGLVAEVLVRHRLDPDRARALLAKMVAGQPYDVDALVLLADLEIASNRPEQALAALRRASVARPEHAMTRRRIEQLSGPGHQAGGPQ